MAERVETGRRRPGQMRTEVKSILKKGGDVAQVAMEIEQCFKKHQPFNGTLPTEQEVLDFAVDTVIRLGSRFPVPLEDAEDGVLQGTLRVRAYLRFPNTRVARDRFSWEYYKRLQETTKACR